MRNVETENTTRWAIAVISAVVIALALAVVSAGLAIRQANSMSIARVQELHSQASAVAESVNSEAVRRIGALLDDVATRTHHPDKTAVMTGLPQIPWISQIFLFDAQLGQVPNWITWQPTTEGGSSKWVRTKGQAESEDRIQTMIMGRMVTSLLTSEWDDRYQRVQFVNDVYEGQEMAIAHIVDLFGLNGRTVVGARIDLQRFLDALVRPQLTGDRIGIVQKLPGKGASLSLFKWNEPLTPISQHLYLVPTDTFVRDQARAVARQTLLFIAGMALAMTALLGIIYAMWRVFNRAITLSSMKQSFVADVSHELKTPLALIRLFGETLLANRVLSEEKRREYYEIITRESDRLTHLINNILDFARIDSGKKQYDTQPTDVADLVRDTYEAYCLQLDHEGFEHQLVVHDDVPSIRGDRDAIAQAVINLINNAMKYTDDGDKFLGIDVSAETRRGQHGVLISVSDRGIGVKPEDRANLFNDFYRSSDDRVRQKRGAGLGLALVKHIVDAHQGIVDVESRLVKGSTFRIFLPENKLPVTSEDEADVQNTDC